MSKKEQGNRPLSSDSSLEDEMINYWGRIPEDKDLVDTARHFALWQMEQMMKEWLKDRDGCFWDGVEEGKKAMEKQMMKEVVEGLFWYTPFPTICLDDCKEYKFKDNQKVRIIIVKEDER